MADTKISALTAAAAAAAANELAINEAGTSKKVTVAQIAALIYPVGSIYISTASTNPNTLFGFGTWAAFGAGRVIVGLDSGDTDFDTSEETGGAKTVASSAQTFAGTSSTTVVNHVHAMTSLLVRSSATGAASTIVNGIADASATLAGPYDTDNPKTNGAASYTPAGTNTPGAATSVVQPYIVAYMFKRTA